MTVQPSKRARQVSISSESSDDVLVLDKYTRTADAGSSSGHSLLTCSLPPTCHTRPRSFTSLGDFESHYASHHSYNCVSCGAHFPSQKWLDLHLQELHDPLWMASRDRGESVVECFECTQKFKSAAGRRRHLQSDHAYPPEFRYNIVTKGIPATAISLLYDAPLRKTKTKTKTHSKNKKLGLEEGQDPAGTDQGETEVRMTRLQRRAQARADQTAKTTDGSAEAGKETETETAEHPIAHDKDDKKARRQKGNMQINRAKQAHADAVKALFRGLEDPDTLEPSAPNQEDAQMDDLATVMDRSHLVPSRIRFGHS